MVLSSITAVSVAALQVIVAYGHSWVSCTDYRGDVNFFEQDKCLAFPRQWDNRNGATSPLANGYQIGIDTGRDHQPPSACDIAMTTPDWRDGYSGAFPYAIYEPGQVYCLAWPMKNHAAASCTNPFIPDTSLTLLVSSVDPINDPTQAAFNGRNINELAGFAASCNPSAPGSRELTDECQLGLEKHQQGQVDCKGFQRSPKFCLNTDRAMGTGCFKVPDNMAPGHYVGQWYWEFNQGSPYTTCFDFQVVEKGSLEARAGAPGTTGVLDASQLPCTNNVLKFGASLPTLVTTTTAATTSTAASNKNCRNNNSTDDDHSFNNIGSTSNLGTNHVFSAILSNNIYASE